MTTVASLMVTAEDVERTGRIATVAQWGVALVVMVGSAAAAGFTFEHLGESWALGVGSALGVDLALAAWLRIAARLRAVGVRSAWGVVLEVATVGMTLFLNVGAAAFKGIDTTGAAAHGLLGVGHAFLPIVLLLVGLAGSEAQSQLRQVRAEAHAAEQAQREAKGAAEKATREAEAQRVREQAHRRANGELLSAQDVLSRVSELRRQAEREAATAAELRARADAEVAATKAAGEQLAKLRRKQTKPGPPGRGRQPATREQRRQWVREQRAAGRTPSGAEVDRHFGPPRTGAAVVAEVDAELPRATLHAIEGGGGR